MWILQIYLSYVELKPIVYQSQGGKKYPIYIRQIAP